MIAKLLQALHDKGWNAPIIAQKTGISAEKLRNCANINQKELDKLYRLAESEAGIDIDELED